MNNFKINTKDLKLAQLRYYETKYNGTEILPISCYAFLLSVNGQYRNILNPMEELPVYGRVPYSNTTISGEDYGNKIILLSGEEKDGLCYVLENTDVKKMFSDKEVISFKTLKKCVCASKEFFIDRVSILKKERKLIPDSSFYHMVMQKDLEKIEELKKLFEEKESHKKFVKE